MNSPVYLDHAATSFPKPDRVAERVSAYLREEGFSAGRGTYARADHIGREIAVARAALSVLIGAESPDRILFTHSGTESLNLAIQGLLRSGDHVVTTVLAHNSVLRPLTALQQREMIEVSYVEPDSAGMINPNLILQAMRPTTRLVCLVHASNVIGTIQPVQEICPAVRAKGAFSLVDASQSIGHIPIDVQQIGCDLLAAPAHKGLCAPLGTGFVYLKPGMEDHLEPTLYGGTGSESESPVQPEQLPSKYESGSLNVPGLLGLAAALEIVTPEFVVEESKRQAELTKQLLEGLSEIPSIQVHPNGQPNRQRLGVVSLSIINQDPRVIGTILDEHFHIETRTGFHCAPKTHQWLGTAPQGGTIRLSIGHSTTNREIEQAISALKEISNTMC